MRVKTSITLPRELLDRIDEVDSNRSALIERAARSYLAQVDKLAREERDARIIRQNVDRLNRETADALDYQQLK